MKLDKHQHAKKFAKILDKELKKSGKNQTDFCKEIGMQPYNYSAYRNGKGVPNEDNQKILEKYFGMPLIQVIEGGAPAKPASPSAPPAEPEVEPNIDITVSSVPMDDDALNQSCIEIVVTGDVFEVANFLLKLRAFVTHP